MIPEEGTCDAGDKPHTQSRTCVNWKPIPEESIIPRAALIWLSVYFLLIYALFVWISHSK